MTSLFDIYSADSLWYNTCHALSLRWLCDAIFKWLQSAGAWQFDESVEHVLGICSWLKSAGLAWLTNFCVTHAIFTFRNELRSMATEISGAWLNVGCVSGAWLKSVEHDWNQWSMTEVSGAWLKSVEHDWNQWSMTEISGAWLKSVEHDWSQWSMTEISGAWLKSVEHDWSQWSMTEISGAWLKSVEHDWNQWSMTEISGAWLKSVEHDWNQWSMTEVSGAWLKSVEHPLKSVEHWFQWKKRSEDWSSSPKQNELSAPLRGAAFTKTDLRAKNLDAKIPQRERAEDWYRMNHKRG